MSEAPAESLGTSGSYASSIPAFHRVQELNLEEKQLQLDQELRSYMNREGMLMQEEAEIMGLGFALVLRSQIPTVLYSECL